MDLRKDRVAHRVPTALKDGPVISEKNSRVPIALRQFAVTKYYEFLLNDQIKEEASTRALEHELDVYKSARNKGEYKNLYMSRLSKLKDKKNQANIDRALTCLIKLDEVFSRLEELLVPLSTLTQVGFPLVESLQRIDRTVINKVECNRCKKPFIPNEYYNLSEPESCQYHFGRLGHVRNIKSKIWSCCNADENGPTCTIASRHVFYHKHIFEDDQVHCTDSWPTLASQLRLASIDGEMCHSRCGLDICRLTMVDWDEKRVLDVLIHPSSEIIDYNTRYSGLSAESFSPNGFSHVVPAGMEPRVLTMEELMKDVLPKLIGPDTVLVGHSLENDLLSLRLSHRRIIDTAVLYPHNKGLPYRMALRDLTRVHLKQFVQEASSGHDSYEDCVACIRLLKLKL